MDIIQQMMDRAKNNKQCIVLPEGTEERTLKAANILLSEDIADLILIGNKEKILAEAREWSLNFIEKANIIDPEDADSTSKYADLLYDLRKEKGLTKEEAIELVKNPLYLACLLIKNGDADGEVAGAMNTTSNVLRPAFQIIKTLPDINVVSGAFLMFTSTPCFGEDGLVIFADCAVHPDPTAEELAQIAVCTAATTKRIAGFEPRIAMLSFSTKGSAKHPSVDKVVEATNIVKRTHPEIQIDGELQADAAIVPSVAANKAPESKIAGRANVFVFPDLQSGNIGYKLVQRFANAYAVGPILQGMAAPVNDLSRGCSVEDIVKMVAITANQAIGNKLK